LHFVCAFADETPPEKGDANAAMTFFITMPNRWPDRGLRQ
jgi:hypothetical protein